MNNAIPKNSDAEKYLLGCIASYPDRAGEVLESGVAEADLVDPMHRKLWRAFARQYAETGKVDPVLAGREANAVGDLLLLVRDVVTTTHAPAQAEKVIDASRKRKLASITEAALEAAQNGHAANDVYEMLKGDLEDFASNAKAVDRQKPDIVTFGDLAILHPHLNEPVIDGLLREGETCNIISHSKVGKSWLAYSLALSVVAGEDWLRQFPTAQGKVLLIDNELHGGTLVSRVPSVANAMGIPPEHYRDDLRVWSLRGRLESLDAVESKLANVEPGEYKLIILDAWYRFQVGGESENDNAAVAARYNQIDRLAERTGAAVVAVHHTSKGSQSEKRITDVGAGAGAQSRAADCHLVLREHEEDGVVVLDAAVRSFKPVVSLALQWEFPLWVPVAGIDPVKLKGRGTRNEERQRERDQQGREATVKALQAGPATQRALRRITGFRQERQDNILNLLCSAGNVACREVTIRGNKTHEYFLPE